MNAFIKTPDGLHKIYRQGDDWQVIFPNQSERWFSVWNNQDIKTSLMRAVLNIPNANEDDLVIVDLGE